MNAPSSQRGARWLVAGVFLILMLSSGFGFYNLSVYLKVLGERGFSVSHVSAAIGVFFLVGGLVGPFIGRLLQRSDARWVIAFGAVSLCDRRSILQWLWIDAVLHRAHGASRLMIKWNHSVGTWSPTITPHFAVRFRSIRPAPRSLTSAEPRSGRGFSIISSSCHTSAWAEAVS